MRASEAVLSAAAAPAGAALSAAIASLAALRGPRPIHTAGVRLEGSLIWLPAGRTASGIACIDDRVIGRTPVVARLSRGASLPARLPDVIGLAIRIGPEGRDGDLLLSSTGIGVPGRFLLRPARTPDHGLLSTLMPYRGSRGPVLIAARSVTPATLPAQMTAVHRDLLSTSWRLDLLFASPVGKWHRFAVVELRASDAIDSADLRFDPVLRPPRGAGTYAWTRMLREPSYRTARRRGRPTRVIGVGADQE